MSVNSANAADDDEALRNQCDELVEVVNTFDISKRGALIVAINQLVGDVSKFAGRSYVLSNKPAPTAFSISQLRGVYTSLEILWNLDVSLYIDARFELGSIFQDLTPWAKSFLLSQNQLSLLSSSFRKSVNSSVDMADPPISFYRGLSDTLFCMVGAVQSHAFTTHMLQRNIRRLLACCLLLQRDLRALQQRPGDFDDTVNLTISQILVEANSCVEDVTSRNVYLTVSQLRTLPPVAPTADRKAYVWLRSEFGRIFSGLLASSKGSNLDLVIKGYLDGVVDGSDSAKLQSIIAVTVLTAPKSIVGLTEDGYYCGLLPQIVDLFNYAVQNADNVLARLCVLIVQRLAVVSFARQPVQDESSWIRKLLCSLLQPLRALVSQVDVKECSALNATPGGAGSMSAGIVVTVDQVAICVKLLHALVYMCPVGPRLVVALQDCHFHLTMIKLGCFILGHASLYHLKPLVLEYCRIYFGNTSSVDVVANLEVYLLERNIPFIFGVDFRTKDDGIEIGEVEVGVDSGLGVSEFMQLLKSAEPDISLTAQGSKEDTGNESADILRTLQAHGLDAGDSYGGGSGGMSSTLLSTYQRAGALADLLLQCVDMEAAVQPVPVGESGTGKDPFGSSVVPSELFMTILRGYLHLSAEEVESTRLACGLVLVCLKEKFPMHALLQSGLQIIELIRVFLDGFACRWATGSGSDGGAEEHVCESEDCEEHVETMSTILSLLSSIVVLGSKDRPREEEESLRACLPALRQVAAIRAGAIVQEQGSDTTAVEAAHQKSVLVLVETAVDVALLIMTRGQAPGPAATPVAPAVGVSSASYERVLLETRDKYLMSGDPSLRAYGVSIVTVRLREVLTVLDGAETEERCQPGPASPSGRKLIEVVGEETRDSAPAVEPVASAMRDGVLTLTVDVLLTHALLDAESFVFLAAVHSLWRLGDLNRRLVVDKLLFYLQQEAVMPVEGVGSQFVPSCKNKMLLVETLARVVRRAGAAAPVYVAQVLPVAMRMVRAVHKEVDRSLIDSTLGNGGAAAAAHVDVLTKMKVVAVAGISEEDGGSNAVAQRAVEALISGAEQVLLRQSILSLVAECLAVSGYSAGKYIVDVVGLMSGILRLEQPRPADSADQAQARMSARRTAAFCLRYVVNGLEQKLFQNMSLESDQLRLIYEALKIAAADKQDKVTKFHGEVGLSVLAQNIQLQLFPQLSTYK